jgi:hypothetical protein
MGYRLYAKFKLVHVPRQIADKSVRQYRLAR